MAKGFPLSLQSLAGEIYYTLDGPDPRLPGGAISPAASRAAPAAKSDLVAAGADARFLVPADGALGFTWTDPRFDDSGWLEGKTAIGFSQRTPAFEVATDVGTLMLAISSSLYVRIPFVLEGEPPPLLVLRLKYDDGFIAYLNGEEIARRNAP